MEYMADDFVSSPRFRIDGETQRKLAKAEKNKIAETAAQRLFMEAERRQKRLEQKEKELYEANPNATGKKAPVPSKNKTPRNGPMVTSPMCSTTTDTEAAKPESRPVSSHRRQRSQRQYTQKSKKDVRLKEPRVVEVEPLNLVIASNNTSQNDIKVTIENNQ